jgi:hypothetical protein
VIEPEHCCLASWCEGLRVKHIDEVKLETDTTYRFQYMTEFVGFGEAEIKVVLGAAALLAPVVPSLVNAVYDKLFSYDVTKKHFMPKQFGYDGVVPTDLNELNHDHPMIKFRKEKLTRYLVKLVSGPYDGKMIDYLDMVGRIHTPMAGARSISIPLIQMNALMGFVSDAITATIMTLQIPDADKVLALRAFNKLLWIQNDLITRHYQDESLKPKA